MLKNKMRHLIVGLSLLGLMGTTSIHGAGIFINGDFSDWDTVSILGSDSSEDVNPGDVVDWVNLWATRHCGNLYLSYETVGEINLAVDAWRYAVYLDTDADGALDLTTVSIISAASNGGTTVNPLTGVVTYTPNNGFVGQDVFTYTVNDNDGGTSNAATVTVSVSDSGLGVLDPNSFLILVTGNVTDTLIQPPLGQGSWFSMEVQPGQPLHTAIAGFNHLQLGVL